jgi:predicted alpha/beta-hydrolase family hydrolase
MADNPTDALDLLTEGPSGADWTLILAHGAGQGMDSAFMAHMASSIARADVRVIRFEFPYMAEMRRTGRRKPPNREPVLLERWNQVIDQALAVGTDPRRLLIGGKSLGGRMASLIADERAAAGLVCLGYPFHPPGKPDRTRTEHLRGLRTPTFICQGTRDPFGTPDEVPGCALAPSIRLAWSEDGDHSFKPRRQSGRTWEQNLEQALEAVLGFVTSL